MKIDLDRKSRTFGPAIPRGFIPRYLCIGKKTVLKGGVLCPRLPARRTAKNPGGVFKSSLKYLLAAAAFFLAAVPAGALDLGGGFNLSGGVKTGLEIKNSDYTGKLEGLAHGEEYPLTLYFASRENETYNGEAWLEFDYSREDLGIHLGTWAHGNLKNFDGSINLGDHYIWANFYRNRLLFKGGQGGGAPITSGGWINADWLGYTGLRVFWFDPSLGISLGINFVDPGKDGIKPVNYLSTIMFGAKYAFEKFWAVLMWDNNPIYDDSEANTDGGLHRNPNAEPIAQAGNIAFGLGLNDIFWGKGSLALDGLITNLGENDVETGGNYKISPIETAIAFKGAWPVTEQFYAEVKAKYTFKQGDNADETGTAIWGQIEFEPYASYVVYENIKAELSLNLKSYFNSYYLAADINVSGQELKAGQTGAYPAALDYLSPYQFNIKPAVIFTVLGGNIICGYEGIFSRDHVENILYVDFRWSF